MLTCYSRVFDQSKFLRFVDRDLLNNIENILITVSKGIGKSYFSIALGYQVFIDGYRVMYFNMTKLFSKFKMAKAFDSYLK